MRDENTSKRGGGRPAAFPAATLPRTVLSAAQNADEARTAVLARVEMRSWRILQLEPSALRQPNDLQAPTRLGVNGANLAATLYRIALSGDPGAHCADISNRLAGLIDEVRSIKVDRDDARRLLQVVMTDRAGLDFPASSLSDGTLRFIALSVLERDPEATGITCLEEPENGIHPERMGAMIDLLRDMSVDCEAEVSDDNPLRQVIVSTHSPIVAARVSAEELVFAERRDARLPDGRLAAGLALRALEGSWRDRAGGQPVARGRVLRYLGSFRPAPDEAADSTWQRFGEQLQFHFGAAHANT